MTAAEPSQTLLQNARRKLRWAIDRYVLPDAMLMRKQYLRRNGFLPDLVEPRDLSEKILWLKLHDRSPLHTQCADKIRARDYVAARLGPELIIPAIHVTRDPADVNPETIAAERFVVKTNHDQGGVFLCRDRSTFRWGEVRENVAKRLAINKYYEFREYQYKHIRPGILVEELIETDSPGNASEIKIVCFHGEPGFVQAIVGCAPDRRHTNLDLDWNRLPFFGRSPDIGYDVERPRALDRMLAAARRLSEPFLFCRIDFLVDADGRPWFGEITFHHGAGLLRFRPDESERALGDMIDLSRLAESRRRQRAILGESRRPDRDRACLQEAR